MNFDTTIRDLEQERDLINLAITAVQNARDNRVGMVGTVRNLRTVNRTPTRGGVIGTGKRHLSAAAKLRISQAMKARWEARKAGKKLTVVRGKKAA